MNVKAKVWFTLNICFEVSHFKVVIYPVHNEVREPWIFSASLEELIEKFEALLSKVISEYFETHECLILRKCLSKQSQS